MSLPPPLCRRSLNQAIAAYEAVNESITIVPTYDSSGTLKTQIQEGADCDVFISAAPKQMNQLDAQGGEENSEGLDFVDSASTSEPAGKQSDSGCS